MKWQWKLGRFAGIDVFVHATFLLIIGWVGYSHWLMHRDWLEVFKGIGFILALFGCVVLHEYGHALTARRFGTKTRDITLYPIGCFVRLNNKAVGVVVKTNPNNPFKPTVRILADGQGNKPELEHLINLAEDNVLNIATGITAEELPR